MEMDLYSACPCGSGKKIKFCCPREHVNDYLKVFELIEAQQFAAASELTDRLVSKAPNQICFLALKATFLDPSDEAETRRMGEQLDAVAPQHPIAHAAHAVIALYDGDLAEAIQRIQNSIERLENAVPSLLLTALSMTANVALQKELFFTAVAHASYVQMLTKARHSASGQLLHYIRTQSNLPSVAASNLLDRLKIELGDGVPARLAALVMRGKWRVARAEAERLLEQQPQNAGALGILAIVTGSLGDEAAAADYWRRLGELPEISDELATDALILANCVSVATSRMYVPLMVRTMTLKDVDGAMERLLSHPRAQSRNQPRYPSDSPPPKATFVIWDRELGEASDSPVAADLPRFVCALRVFGRETDRDARIEISFSQSDESRLEATISELLGETVTLDGENEAIGHETWFGDTLLRELRFHPNTPMETRARVGNEIVQQAAFTRFLEIPNPMLQDKTPLECVGLAEMRRPLMAVTLWLETSDSFQYLVEGWNELWERLQLSRPISVTSIDELARLSETHLVRINVSELSDELLGSLIERLLNIRQPNALIRACEEYVRRPHLRAEEDLSPLFAILETVTRTPQASLRWTEEAVAWCRERQLPEGRWLVRKFPHLVMLGRSDEARALVERIMSRHSREPGVLEDLREVFVEFGILTPEGQPTQQFQAAREATGESSGGIWTPDQGDPAAPAAPSESKLWVPGMD